MIKTYEVLFGEDLIDTIEAKDWSEANGIAEENLTIIPLQAVYKGKVVAADEQSDFWRENLRVMEKQKG